MAALPPVHTVLADPPGAVLHPMHVCCVDDEVCVYLMNDVLLSKLRFVRLYCV
jgi:hypothetical protein